MLKANQTIQFRKIYTLMKIQYKYLRQCIVIYFKQLDLNKITIIF